MKDPLLKLVNNDDYNPAIQVKNQDEFAEELREFSNELVRKLLSNTTEETYKLVVGDIMRVNNTITDAIIRLRTHNQG
jgi:predicted house-cleaning noncanonical NTP pyrophosphatase (MazG superfamily)